MRRDEDELWELRPTEMRLVRAVRALPPVLRDHLVTLAEYLVEERLISDDLLLYKAGRTVYVNRVLGRCSGLSFGRTLVTTVWGSQICRGDIARVADLSSGMLTGSCALGDFVPYTPTEK